MNKPFGVLAAISLTVAAMSFTQPDQTTANEPKTLTEKDKEVIIAIFKTIPTVRYRFSFGTRYYGEKWIPKPMYSNLDHGGNPSLSDAIVRTYFPDVKFWFVVTIPAPPAEGLEGVFEKANAARLNTIIKKYTVAGN